MRINIVTVFKSENCGSFLQAWALKETLSSLGGRVRFCDYKSAGNTPKKRAINVIKCCLRFRFQRASDILKKTAQFKKQQKKLGVVRGGEGADLCFFGSDTLWNFDDAFFAQNAPFFTGRNVKEPCFAYSMSVGSTSKETVLAQNEAVKSIQEFKGIAVRDAHTWDVLSEIYPCDAMVRTVDPTMLVDKETYISEFSNVKHCAAKSLVVYYFGVIPEEMWKVLQAFAKKRGLTIINVGLHGDRAAPSVVASPVNFISAFANAEYIFTNTFHGCVFSTIFNKPFATNGIHKKKIEGFLEEFSLLDRVVSDASEIATVLTTPVEYERVNALIKEKRDASIEYLDRCIREVNGLE